MKQKQRLSLADLGITRDALTPAIARTVSESLRSLADGAWYGSTARWSSDALRALADEIDEIAQTER